MREGRPEDVAGLVGPGADVVVGMANGEPVAVLDALEDVGRAGGLDDVRVHQMHALHRRASIDGAVPGLRHVSWFLSAATREAHRRGDCDLVPADFSAVPGLLRAAGASLMLAAASPPDAAGWCTLGTNAEYVAALLGHVPVFLEVNEQMPRTAGHHRVHLGEVAGWCQVDRPLVTVAGVAADDRDRAIGRAIAGLVPDGATLQVGIGRIPDAVLAALRGHRDLGVHTELVSDGVMDLVRRGVVTGARKRTRPGRVVATFALGTQALYDWLDDNDGVELHPVDRVNDPRRIARERRLVSINATTEVDLLGQCASETIAGRPGRAAAGRPTSRAARCGPTTARRSWSCTARPTTAAAGSGRC
jgi:acyl-CoA hydrolase